MVPKNYSDFRHLENSLHNKRYWGANWRYLVQRASHERGLKKRFFFSLPSPISRIASKTVRPNNACCTDYLERKIRYQLFRAEKIWKMSIPCRPFFKQNVTARDTARLLSLLGRIALRYVTCLRLEAISTHFSSGDIQYDETLYFC